LATKPLDIIFESFLSSDYSFEIPNYQRPYSWKTDQVEELFDDLTYFAFQRDDIDDLKPYFFGSIVLIKEKISYFQKLLMDSQSSNFSQGLRIGEF